MSITHVFCAVGRKKVDIRPIPEGRKRQVTFMKRAPLGGRHKCTNPFRCTPPTWRDTCVCERAPVLCTQRCYKPLHIYMYMCTQLSVHNRGEPRRHT